jgi:hypothetical protein
MPSQVTYAIVVFALALALAGSFAITDILAPWRRRRRR